MRKSQESESLLNCLTDTPDRPFPGRDAGACWEVCQLPFTRELGEWGPESRGSRLAETDKGGRPFGERYKAKSQKRDPPAGGVLPSCCGQGRWQLGAQLARQGGSCCAELQLRAAAGILFSLPRSIRRQRREGEGAPKISQEKG